MIKRLPETARKAIEDLKIIEKTKNGKTKDETVFFSLYFNRAMCNICEFLGISSDGNHSPASLEVELEKSQKLDQLASFLWLFKDEDPKKNYPDYKKRTITIIRKICELRSFFTHLRGSSEPLLATRDLYIFFHGLLLPQLRKVADQKGFQTEKLYKLKLLNIHNQEKGTYEFTRKGLIFLCCMALYRDEAMEFCSLFDDLKLPNKNDLEVVKNASTRKALRVMFTELSYPKRRQESNIEDLKFLSYTDIMNYLNTVPIAAFDALKLTSENQRLAELFAKSEESEENKQTKYVLRKRYKNRFLPLATGFIEDFNILPSLHFKRLDISDNIGRKKYSFGAQNDNRNKLNRHYITHNGFVHFSYIPKKHYGPIKIKELHSSISESELKALLAFWGLIKQESMVNNLFEDYFSTYHRVLENLLNIKPEVSENPWFLYFEEFEQDFAKIANVPEAEIEPNLEKIMDPYFSNNILRIFKQNDEMPTNEELADNLEYKLKHRKAKTQAFINKLNEQKKRYYDYLSAKKQDPSLKQGRLSKEDKFSDGDFVAQVFHLFNILLDSKDKFRQLPLGEQHRDGIKDHEYQILHEIIGKCNTAKNSYEDLEKFIERQRPMLYKSPEFKQMISIASNLKKQEVELITKNQFYDKNGKFLRTNALKILAEAAAQTRLSIYNETLKWLDNKTEKNLWCGATKELHKKCMKFGVRIGLPYEYKNLIKSVLRLDLDTWQKAFDYDKKAKSNRKLEDVEHIVSQIPLPTGFITRLVKAQRNHKQLKDLYTNERFHVTQAIMKLPLKINLRDFYNASPLISWLKNHSQQPEINSDFILEKKSVQKMIDEIQSTHLQDRLLLLISLSYKGQYAKESKIIMPAPRLETTSIYDYYDDPFSIKIGCKYTIEFQINDVNRPVFAQIYKHAPTIIKSLDPLGEKFIFHFTDLLAEYQRILAKDRVIRLDLLPRLNKMESSVELSYIEGSKTKEEKRQIQFDVYKRMYPNLSRDEYNALADIRNMICHDGFFLVDSVGPARKILDKLNI